jgi:HD-GYP domain-containing protein (c-di-GMP phosphodiesterase class II)
MAVADIFAAISEDRPYRKGMPKERAVTVLQGMAANGGISPEICALLIDNYESISQARRESAQKSADNYSKII